MNMRNCRVGSIVGTEPKIIWVKMINCPVMDKLQSLHFKYNDILEETLAGLKDHYIMSITNDLKAEHFDRVGNLMVKAESIFGDF